MITKGWQGLGIINRYKIIKKLNQALNEQQFNNIQHNENYEDEEADDRRFVEQLSSDYIYSSGELCW